MAAFDPTRILSDERFAGKRAPFHVYYKNAKGKFFVQAVYAANEDGAKDWLCRAVKKAEIVRVVSTEGTL